MNIKDLNEIADTDSVSCSIDNASGIVSVVFQVREIWFNTQFDAQNKGLYAFGVNDTQAEELFGMLREQK